MTFSDNSLAQAGYLIFQGDVKVCCRYSPNVKTISLVTYKAQKRVKWRSKETTSWLALIEKSRLFMFVVSESVSIFSILHHPCSSFACCYLLGVQFKGNFIHVHKITQHTANFNLRDLFDLIIPPKRVTPCHDRNLYLY